MNIRRNVDYSKMYAKLDMLIERQLGQMKLYCEIGKAVSQRTEKGAAVAAAEYLTKKYPDVQGFSPRNLRRMRDFYRTYEAQPTLLSLALQLGWTQNVVILEADLSMELRGWYLKATKQFGWSKAELIEKIATNAHEMIVLAIGEVVRYTEKQDEVNQKKSGSFLHKENKIQHLIQKGRYRMKSIRGNGRRWPIKLCPICSMKRIICMFYYTAVLIQIANTIAVDTLEYDVCNIMINTCFTSFPLVICRIMY